MTWCESVLIGFRRLRRCLPQQAFLTIVKGLVFYGVRYCLSVYGNGSAANDAKLLKVRNFATRAVTGLRKFDHVSHARDDLGLLGPS